MLQQHWERMRGVDFTSVTHPEDLGFDPKRVYRSMPSGGWDLYRVLMSLGIHRGDRILDIGCGKGSAMRTMLRFPFEAVHGIEISPDIAAVWVRNFERLGTDDPRLRIFVEDAATFTRYADYKLFYFFNPFPAVVMQQVLQRLVGATQRRSDGIRIIYNNPKCHDIVMACGFILERSFRALDGIRINVYRIPERLR